MRYLIEAVVCVQEAASMRYLIEAVVCVRRRECTWVRLSRVGSIGRQYRGTPLKRKFSP